MTGLHPAGQEPRGRSPAAVGLVRYLSDVRERQGGCTGPRVIADEGYKFVDKSARKTLQHETYIVEVHPEGEPAFRAEVKAWVSWPDMSKVGDTVQVTYCPGTHRVELDVKGDPRFDWKLLEAQNKADAAETRKTTPQ
jgi:hypothetical protein